MGQKTDQASDQLCLINSHKFTCGTVGVDRLLLGQDWVAVFPDVSCEEEAFFWDAQLVGVFPPFSTDHDLHKFKEIQLINTRWHCSRKTYSYSELGQFVLHTWYNYEI